MQQLGTQTWLVTGLCDILYFTNRQWKGNQLSLNQCQWTVRMTSSLCTPQEPPTTQDALRTVRLAISSMLLLPARYTCIHLIDDRHLFASSKPQTLQPALYCMYKYPGQLEQINIQVKICCMYIELNTNFTFFLVVHFWFQAWRHLWVYGWPGLDSWSLQCGVWSTV